MIGKILGVLGLFMTLAALWLFADAYKTQAMDTAFIFAMQVATVGVMLWIGGYLIDLRK